MRFVPISLMAFLVCLPAGTTTFGQETAVDIQKLEKKIQDVLPKLRSCTVGVGSGGSGVVVTKEGLVLTCAHVAKRAGQRIRISFQDGKSVRATTLGNYHTADAGLIRIDEPGEYPFVPMAASDEAKVGDWVLAIGYPVSFPKRTPPPVRIGRVLRSARNVLISDAPIMGGDSGGPLFSLDGTVIGISSRVSSNIASNVSVPIDQFRSNWDRLLASEDWPERDARTAREGRRPRRPQNSPSQSPGSRSPAKQATSPVFKKFGIEVEKTDKGVSVKSLTLGLLADKSGVRAGHILLQIGDTEIKTVEQCREALEKYVGKQDTVNITVTRAAAGHAKVTKVLRLKEQTP